MAHKPLNIIGLVYPGFNTLDLNGPTEAFRSSSHPSPGNVLTVASATDITTSFEGPILKRNLSFIELLAKQDDGTTELDRFDILLLPGAPAQHVLEAIEKDPGLMKVIETFANRKPDGRPKWLFSVCTGALFLGAAGLLGGRTVTTHFRSLDKLDEICKKAGKEANVVRKRWVDAGKTETGIRIVNAGGVSCGIDATLWILSEVFGLERAKHISASMDYDWGFEKVETSEGWIV